MVDYLMSFLSLSTWIFLFFEFVGGLLVAYSILLSALVSLALIGFRAYLDLVLGLGLGGFGPSS